MTTFSRPGARLAITGSTTPKHLMDSVSCSICSLVCLRGLYEAGLSCAICTYSTARFDFVVIPKISYWYTGTGCGGGLLLNIKGGIDFSIPPLRKNRKDSGPENLIMNPLGCSVRAHNEFSNTFIIDCARKFYKMQLSTGCGKV